MNLKLVIIQSYRKSDINVLTYTRHIQNIYAYYVIQYLHNFQIAQESPLPGIENRRNNSDLS